MGDPKTAVRMDKWLWAARFFKTRSLATHACELGRINWNGQRAKAAREVRPGDKVQISTAGGDFTVEVLGLSDMRGPASVAQTLYRETEESKHLRAAATAARKEVPQYEGEWGGRPSKQDRRTLNRLRGRY
jgi:ribosome-associated heat shock protein Hsp15